MLGEPLPSRRDVAPFVLPARIALDSGIVAMVCVSTGGELLSANRGFCERFGVASLAELLQKDFKAEILADADQWAAWLAASESTTVTDQDVVIRTVSGERRHLSGEIRLVADAGRAPFLAGVFTDVTERVQLQGALQRAGRMEMVGALAGGIMHDLNNLLTILVGNLYLVGEAVRGDATVFEKTKRARDAAKRGTDLTRHLLSFARADSDGTRRVDVGGLIESLEPLLTCAMGSRTELTTEIEPDVAQVVADPAQLESVVVNLTKNAVDAIDGEGTVHIRIANRKPNQAERAALGLSARRYVSIAVADNGPGIPDEIKTQIFEPFFSTKGKRRGTGLGLSMVRWIAEELGGAIALDTAPGKGTTFTLWLPATTRPTNESTVDTTMPLSTLPTGTETTLVIAADSQLRQTIKESLEILGYTVICGDGSCDPLAEQPGVAADLMLIDQAVPQAAEILAAMRARKPSLRIVSIGEGGGRNLQHAVKMVQMPQPFALIDIARTVRQTLDGAAGDK